MGRQYGELAKVQLQDVFDFCNRMIEANEGNTHRVVSIIGVQVEQMPLYNPGILPWCCGNLRPYGRAALRYQCGRANGGTAEMQLCGGLGRLRERQNGGGS